MFADDLKLYRIIQNPHDIETLQQDWNYISDWSKLWDYKEQCYASELKWQGQVHTLFILATNSNTLLQSTLEQKDLEVWITPSMTFTVHYHKSASKPNQALDMMKCNFKYMSESSFIILFVQPDKHIWSTVP